MDGNIDRRASVGGLQHYLFSQQHFFTSMENHEIKDFCYFTSVSQILPKNWSIQRREAWYVVKPDQIKIKRYGFKIHISLVSEITEHALKKIIPIIIKYQVAFKFLVDPEMHDFFNSQACSKISAGKFLTVYPPNLGIFKKILQSLHKITKDFFGPFILSDQPYKNSKCLFYRFGSFVGNKQRNIFGEYNPAIINVKGDIDIRLPYYSLPKGVSDPFKKAIQYPETSLLNQRYQVIEALSSHSSKGGVYLANDTKTDTKVVLKEARPFINRSQRSKKDAITGLIHEEHILNRLQNLKVTPKVKDSFCEWQHHFLVLEYIPFSTLDYSEWQEHNILLIKGIKNDFVNFCKKHLILLKNIIDTVEKIHQMGIIIGDIAPHNILFHPKTMEVRFIDLEGAYDQKEEKFYARNTSRGFTTYCRDKRKKPTQLEDWGAVSALSIHLLKPVCPLFAINTSAKKAYLESLVKSHGLPLKFIAIEKLLRQNQILEAKQTILVLSNMIKSGAHKKDSTLSMQSHIYKLDLPQILGKMVDYIEHFIKYPLKKTVFPLDYRALTSSKLSVAYGATGVLYFMHKRNSILTQKLASMVLNELQNEDLNNFPPGLYIGLSGIAWVLSESGFETEALDLMKQVYNSKLRNESADFFYGASGWGLASLYFYDRTNSLQFFDCALEAAQVIDNKLNYKSSTSYQNIDEHFYSGLMHGNAGIALFFLRLFQLSQDNSYLKKAKSIMQSEIDKSQIMDYQLVWRKDYQGEVIYPYLQFGSIGIGLVAIRFYLTLKDSYYLNLAKKIADSVTGKYCIYTGLFIGMAGLGIFFLDLYLATQHKNYLQEAHKIADRIMLYQCCNDQGIVFPGDKLAALCTDYGTGSAGIGLFLHRLSKQGKGKEIFIDLK